MNYQSQLEYLNKKLNDLKTENRALKKLILNHGPVIRGGSGGITSGGITLGEEQQLNTGLTDTADAALAAGILIVCEESLIALPDTSDFWIVSSMEWKNGSTVVGNVMGGACLIDGIPPVSTSLQVVAATPSTAQSGSGAVQKVTTKWSYILHKDQDLAAFVLPQDGTSKFRRLVGSSQNHGKSGYTFTDPIVPFNSSIAWSAATSRFYGVLYARPVS